MPLKLLISSGCRFNAVLWAWSWLTDEGSSVGAAVHTKINDILDLVSYKKQCSLSRRLDAVDKSIDQILAWMCSVWQRGEAAIIYHHVCSLCRQTCAITKWTKSIRHQTRLHQKGFFTWSTGHIYRNNISQSVFYTLCCWGRLYGRDFRVMTIVPWLLHAELLFQLPSILIHLPAASRSSYLAPGEYHFCCRLGPPFKVIHTSCSE